MDGRKLPTTRAAAWFATFLCVLALVLSFDHDMSGIQSLGAFLSFLPAVFFWISGRHEAAEAKIQHLEERIAQLETRLTAT